MRLRLLSVPLAAAILVGTAGCGGQDSADVKPQGVDVALAPEQVGDGLTLHPNEDEETLRAFANAGDRPLVADGKIWEIRRGDRLVGTLQISTLLPKVDLSDADVRSAMVRQIIPGTLSSIRIGNVEVYTAEVSEKATFLWFGKDMYEVLQIKDRRIEDFEAIATQIIEHQETVPSWEPLPDLIGEHEQGS